MTESESTPDHPNWQELFPTMTLSERMKFTERFRPVHAASPGTLGFSVNNTMPLDVLIQQPDDGRPMIERVQSREKSYWRIWVGVSDEYDGSLPAEFEGVPVETYPSQRGVAL